MRYALGILRDAIVFLMVAFALTAGTILLWGGLFAPVP
jgi:hypothetical protein